MRVGSARDADHKKTRGFSFQRQCLLVLSGQKQPGTITVVFVGGMNSGKVFPEKTAPNWLVLGWFKLKGLFILVKAP